MKAKFIYGGVLAALLLVQSTHAAVLCAKPRPDGTFNASVKIRDVCRAREVQLDPADLELTGEQGPPGPQGTAGPQGPLGPQGLQGERGLPGDAATPGSGIVAVSAEAPGAMTFTEGVNYCIDLLEGGYGDWRIPTFDELQFALITGVPTPLSVAQPSVWTRTRPFSSYDYFYEMFNVDTGHHNATNPSLPLGIRCVR